MKQPKLKPCPFCGSAESVESVIIHYSLGPHWVKCRKCNCVGPCKHGDSAQTVARKWNRRKAK